ncbi:MAG TPA: amidohydrolase family protein [Candidatus Margulisiibacteriota bacterium]|nr:amidohydrolase family protein [Candidatus Margulisiibacteriota bacterium]
MADDVPIRAIDCWVNPFTPEHARTEQPEFLVRVATDYFHREQQLARGTPLDEMVRMMDDAGIEGGILTINAADPQPFAKMARQYPGRFLLSAVIDPLQAMEALRTIERLVKEYDVRLIRMVPFLFNRPSNDKACYPIYAKCIELGVAVSVNTGIPGPPMPAEPQRPLYLDEVCLFFPELVLIMAHGADPWWGEAIRLLLKYPNLYMMTSAYLPKYLPQELLHFMNTRGQDKVLFATDFPFLPFDRAIATAKALSFRPGVLRKYLRDNAARLFHWD